MNSRRHLRGERRGPASTSTPQKLGLIGLGLALAVLGLALVEGGLTLVGAGEAERFADPFVGFAPGRDLFVRRTLTGGAEVYVTSPDKLAFFNQQQFPADKAPGTLRIFALGGSTTAGRPYDARVAFPRWLELYLAAADPGRRYEVVNAGAISYASYRVALLMRELVRYQPDLFIVYTGHNEFLEERTYGDILHQSPALKRLRVWLNGLRSYTLARAALLSLGAGPQRPPTTLPGEVATRLDGWGGLEGYRRDPELTRSVLAHFEDNLRRMIAIARAHDVELLFVQPVSNLKDFSPFKSEHHSGLADEARRRYGELLAAGRAALEGGDAESALGLLEQAGRLDPEHAEVHYRSGRALLALQRYPQARAALVRAKELDVAPLRALEPQLETLAAVTTSNAVPLLDLPALLAERSRARLGHDLLGEEFLIDHVHPHLPVHSLIAESLVELLARRGTVRLAAGWGEAERRRLYDEIVAGLDERYYAERDHNLAKVLGWAGKLEEAELPLLRAAAGLPDEPEVQLNLGILYQRTGRPQEAVEPLRRAVALAPGMPEARFNLGVAYGRLGRVAEGVAALEEALRLRPDYAAARHNLEVLLRRQGRGGDAVAALEAVLAADPSEVEARLQLALAYREQGRLEDAAAELERALAVAPENVAALYDLALLRSRLGRDDEALATYRRVLALDPDRVAALNNLGILLAKRGEHRAATERLQRAVELDAGYADAWFNLGLVYDGQGRTADAIRMLEKAIALAPDNGRYHHALGLLLAAHGQPDRARDHLRRARERGIEVPAELLAGL